MKVQPLSIPDVMLITPKVYGDARGYFYESFNAKLFCELTRRLPCQGYNSKVEISDLKNLGLNTAGGRFPKDSCGRHSL